MPYTNHFIVIQRDDDNIAIWNCIFVAPVFNKKP